MAHRTAALSAERRAALRAVCWAVRSVASMADPSVGSSAAARAATRAACWAVKSAPDLVQRTVQCLALRSTLKSSICYVKYQLHWQIKILCRDTGSYLPVNENAANVPPEDAKPGVEAYSLYVRPTVFTFDIPNVPEKPLDDSSLISVSRMVIV